MSIGAWLARRSLAVALVLGTTDSLAAQARPVEFPSWRAAGAGPAEATFPAARHNPPAALVLGGVAGAAIASGAALAIANIDTDACSEPPCAAQAAGVLVVGGLLPPLGVHLANGRRGNFALTLLASTGAGALAVLGVSALGDAEYIPLIPVAQITAAVVTEIVVSNRRARTEVAEP